MERSRRAGWLALGATAIGSGIWTMHFIAMMGFTVQEARINYDKPVTFASLLVAIVVVGIGVFIVGFRGRTVPALLAGGTVTGLGVAAMHYLGMAAMRLHGELRYDLLTVGESIGIAVLAATAALWCAVSVKGAYVGFGASLIMGVAVTAMHYTGMAALSVEIQSHVADGSVGGSAPAAMLAPVLIGPVVFLFLAGVVVALDPPSSAGGRASEPEQSSDTYRPIRPVGAVGPADPLGSVGAVGPVGPVGLSGASRHGLRKPER
jgi:NO-binding membrane sensor protein with MHYT domain